MHYDYAIIKLLFVLVENVIETTLNPPDDFIDGDGGVGQYLYRQRASTFRRGEKPFALLVTFCHAVNSLIGFASFFVEQCPLVEDGAFFHFGANFFHDLGLF
jgi:hypothetical protein